MERLENLRAVGRHWVSLMTGSAVVAIYEILTIGLHDKPGAAHFWNNIPQWAVWEFALLCVVFAQYRAWCDLQKEGVPRRLSGMMRCGNATMQGENGRMLGASGTKPAFAVQSLP